MRDLPKGPFLAPMALPLVGISTSTFGTWANRGFTDDFDYPKPGKGRYRDLSLLDVLVLALRWDLTQRNLPHALLGDGGGRAAVCAWLVGHQSEWSRQCSAATTVTLNLDAILSPVIERLRTLKANERPRRSRRGQTSAQIGA